MRFHVGFSFRPKQLLKWLIPILLGLGLLSVSDFVKADTRIDVSIPDVDTLDICGRSLTDYVNYFNYYSGDKYNFIVNYSDDYTEFVFSPNTYSDMNFYSSVSGANTYLTYFYNTSVDESKIDLMYLSTFVLSYSNDESKCSNVDFLDSPSANQDFLDFIDSYHTSFNFSTINSTNFTGYTQVYSQNVCSRVQISTNRDYIFHECYPESNIIFSSRSIYYHNSAPPVSGFGEHYPTYINGNKINNGEIIDYNYYPPSELPVYGKPIYDLYFVAFASTMNNLKLTYTFYVDSQEDFFDYTSHVQPFIVRSYELISVGTNVYSHKSVNCTLGSHGYSYSSTNHLATLTINGFSCSNLSGLGQVSFYLSMSPDDDKTRLIDDFNYTFSGANTNGVFYDIGNKSTGYILFNYTNLSRQFKMFVSSTNSSSVQVLSVNSSNNYTYMSPYNLTPFEETNNSYNEYYKYSGGMMYGQYGLSINRGLLLTNNYNISQDSTSLNLMFFEGTYIYVDSQGSSSQVCYWNGSSVVCSNIEINFYVEDDREYEDIDYYLKNVEDFINNMTSEMGHFRNLVNTIYIHADPTIRIVMFVFFILFNLLLVIKLIRK